MSLHVERCHHRPFVFRTKGRSGRWFAHCQGCGWLSPRHDAQHTAFVIALAHAESSLR